MYSHYQSRKRKILEKFSPPWIPLVCIGFSCYTSYLIYTHFELHLQSWPKLLRVAEILFAMFEWHKDVQCFMHLLTNTESLSKYFAKKLTVLIFLF